MVRVQFGLSTDLTVFDTIHFSCVAKNIALLPSVGCALSLRGSSYDEP